MLSKQSSSEDSDNTDITVFSLAESVHIEPASSSDSDSLDTEERGNHQGPHRKMSFSAPFPGHAERKPRGNKYTSIFSMCFPLLFLRINFDQNQGMRKRGFGIPPCHSAWVQEMVVAETGPSEWDIPKQERPLSPYFQSMVLDSSVKNAARTFTRRFVSHSGLFVLENSLYPQGLLEGAPTPKIILEVPALLGTTAKNSAIPSCPFWTGRHDGVHHDIGDLRQCF